MAHLSSSCICIFNNILASQISYVGISPSIRIRYTASWKICHISCNGSSNVCWLFNNEPSWRGKYLTLLSQVIYRPRTFALKAISNCRCVTGLIFTLNRTEFLKALNGRNEVKDKDKRGKKKSWISDHFCMADNVLIWINNSKFNKFSILCERIYKQYFNLILESSHYHLFKYLFDHDWS